MSSEAAEIGTPAPGWPEHTSLAGTTIYINVEGASPPWVQELAESRAGISLLIRILRGLLAKGAESPPPPEE